MLNEKFKAKLNLKLLFKGITVLGLSIVILSGISLFNQVYRLDVNEFKETENIIPLEIQSFTTSTNYTQSLLEKANRSTDTGIIDLDNTEDSLKRKASLLSVIYEDRPVINENFGTMTIFRLDRVLPIIHGTSEKQLSQGIGHVETSVLPGENDNFVVAGHRETSFRQLDKLKLGDLIFIQTDVGDFTYEVDDTRIVDGDDTSVIVSTGYASLTLVTCYPFDFVGSAPQRYIVTGTLIQSSIN